MKILVVDDELDICEILKFNLETEGFDVDTACSAEEALQLPLQDYSLILLDVMMGKISGFQMARKMKDNPATAQIPIIFVTALDGEDNLVKGLNIGADDYIAKPLSMKEVKARVRAVLRRSSQPQQTAASPDDSKIVYEGITLDLSAKTVTCDESAPKTGLRYGNIGVLFVKTNKTAHKRIGIDFHSSTTPFRSRYRSVSHIQFSVFFVHAKNHTGAVSCL